MSEWFSRAVSGPGILGVEVKVLALLTQGLTPHHPSFLLKSGETFRKSLLTQSTHFFHVLMYLAAYLAT